MAKIETALEHVDEARESLRRVQSGERPLTERREAHRELRAAFLSADALLRDATALARAHSYEEWGRWRHRLSKLGAARQRHLFEEMDDDGVLPQGAIQAIDNGMSGPAIGDLLHGKAKEPGAPARYGVDFEAILTAPPSVHVPSRAAAPTAPQPASAVEVASLPVAPAPVAPVPVAPAPVAA